MFGKRLATLRKNKNLSQYELADRLKLSRGQIANYEQGQREPDFNTLQKLADFLDVSIDFLLGRTDNPSVPTKGTVIKVAGKEIELTEDEYKVFEEIRKYPLMVNDLAKDPEKKVRVLSATWEGIKKAIDEFED